MQVDGLYQTAFHIEQNIYDAQVTMQVDWNDDFLYWRAWICAVQNTLVVEIENRSKMEAAFEFSIMPGEYNIGEVSGYDDGYTEDAVWFTYGAEPYHVQGKRIVTAVAAGILGKKAWWKLAMKFWIPIIIHLYIGWAAVPAKGKCRQRYMVAGQQVTLPIGRAPIRSIIITKVRFFTCIPQTGRNSFLLI